MLVRNGWQRQFSAAGERLEMALEAFAEMDHEVVLLDPAEDLPHARAASCAGCGSTPVPGLRVIFSRKRHQ
jgi:hypothetical protein